MFLFLVLVAFIVWCLFFTKHQGIGKLLFGISNAIETRAAGLIKLKQCASGEEFSYLTNHEPSKPPMLLLHGFTADKTIWLKFAKLASKDYNLFIPDLMGHGDNVYHKDKSYSAYDQANYVRRFLHIINVNEPINVVGNSMGGMIAAILAKQNNSLTPAELEASEIKINKLVLIDPAGAKTKLAIARKEANHNPFVYDSLEESMAFFDLVMHKPPFMPPAVKAYVAQHNYIGKNVQLTHMLTDFFNPDEFFDEPFTTSAQNVTIIWGKQDGLLPVSDAQHWEKLVKCKVFILSDIGHMPMVECPKQTYSLIH